MERKRIALVTGASSGMGKEFVYQIPAFYKQIDEIWAFGRSEEKLLRLKADIEEEIEPLVIRIFPGDLCDNETTEELRHCLRADNPNVRMLVNAAGFGITGFFKEKTKTNPNDQLGMIDLNCRVLTELTEIVLPYLTKESRIINLASAAAFCPQPGFGVYAATKAYVLSFSRMLNAELKKRHIAVTAVCPGPVDTAFFERSGDFNGVLKKVTMAKPDLVVRQALLDSRKKKECSVYGMPMKLLQVLTKILPHFLILSFFRGMIKVTEIMKKKNEYF